MHFSAATVTPVHHMITQSPDRLYTKQRNKAEALVARITTAAGEMEASLANCCQNNLFKRKHFETVSP